jgi:ABC-2 type transport system permease protein
MMSLLEASWVIARRDFIASVFSRTFILFLIAPMLLFGFAVGFGSVTDSQERASLQPTVAIVADSATTDALAQSRVRLVAGTSDQAFPILRVIAPAENVAAQAQALLADQGGGYSAVLGGTLDHPVLTGPTKIDGNVTNRLQLLIDDARRTAALRASNSGPAAAPIERVITEQAAGNLQMTRRNIAKAGQTIIFTATMLLATLLLSTLVEEKTNKVIEVLAAAVPLDAIFFGKLLAMLGISLVGLALWAGMAGIAYTFFMQVFHDWVTLPDVAPAVGWPIWILLVSLYFTTNFLLLGALFLGIGAQASNIREIQTISMPVTMLQLLLFFMVITVAAPTLGALPLTVDIIPLTSPMAMIAFGAESDMLWPHLVALLWQALWVAIIIRVASRLFRRTVFKSGSAGSLFSFGRRRVTSA